jgi:cytochrome c-type biogenesis protein CcmE
MSGIDDELAQAVREGEATPVPVAGKNPKGLDTAQVGLEPDERKRSWGLLAGVLALGAGVLVFVFNSGEDAVVYSYQVDEIKAQAADLGDRQVRVQGMLVSGTLTRRDEPCEYRFMMQKAGVQGAEALKVQYAQCVVPDTFRDVKGVEVEVTAEGRLAEDGHLEASKIFAKCPSKYEMREGAAAMGKQPDHGGGAPKPQFIEPKVEGIR